jgi:hypothetical protein
LPLAAGVAGLLLLAVRDALLLATGLGAPRAVPRCFKKHGGGLDRALLDAVVSIGPSSTMFQGLLAKNLDKLLSIDGKPLLKNFDRSLLSVALWKGDVLLEDVVVNVDAFNGLCLPFALREAHIGRLCVKIPYGRLYSKPIVVMLDRVLLVRSPRGYSPPRRHSPHRRSPRRFGRRLRASEGRMEPKEPGAPALLGELRKEITDPELDT